MPPYGIVLIVFLADLILWWLCDRIILRPLRASPSFGVHLLAEILTTVLMLLMVVVFFVGLGIVLERF